MALVAEIIPFSVRSGVGTQTINHVAHPSVQAKAYVFVCASNTGTTTNSKIYGVGFSDGTNNIANSLAIGQGLATRTASGVSTTYSLITTQMISFFSGAQRLLSGYVSAMNVGSVELTLDVNNTAGADWFAIMIGGDGVECKVGFYDVSSGSGDVNVGFDVGAFLNLGVPDIGVNSDQAGIVQGAGFATQCPNASDQVGYGIACEPSLACASYQIADVVQADITTSAGGPTDEVSVSAWIANGWSLSMSGSPHGNIGYLAIGGDAVSANLVAITQPTTTGVQNTTIQATDPVLAFFCSTGKVSSATPSTDARMMFGVSDGTTQMSQWWGLNNSSTSADRRSSTTSAVRMLTPTGFGTSTENAAASCALSATNVALNWSAADATQRELWALVLSQNLTAAFNPCGENPQASINVIKQCTPIAGGTTDFPFETSGLSPSTFTLQDGGSQLFPALSPGTYGVTETPPSGWTASYAVSTGDPHTAIVITGTDPVTVTVTNTFQSTEGHLLRLRRFALPYDGNKQIFIPRIEIIAQMGVGNADDPDPVMYLRISPDGGSNWGPFRQLPLGADGDTMIRAYLTRFGQLRNPVAELICDAPVFVGWIRCELPQGFTVGSS